MTREEFTTEMAELKRQESAIRERISALKQKWVECCPFKFGDKVRITQSAWTLSGETKPPEIKEAFIGNVSFRRYSDENPEYDYDLRKVKKDGTMANSSAGIYLGYKYTIEKI